MNYELYCGNGGLSKFSGEILKVLRTIYKVLRRGFQKFSGRPAKFSGRPAKFSGEFFFFEFDLALSILDQNGRSQAQNERMVGLRRMRPKWSRLVKADLVHGTMHKFPRHVVVTIFNLAPSVFNQFGRDWPQTERATKAQIIIKLVVGSAKPGPISVKKCVCRDAHAPTKY